MHHEEPSQDEAEHVNHEDEVCYLMLLETRIHAPVFKNRARFD